MTTHEKLEALARNLWWSWNPEVLDLYRRLDQNTFSLSKNNPVAVLKNLGQVEISDSSLIRDIDTAYAALQGYLHSPGKYRDSCRVSYFCMEFGLHESLPIYSGGLGVLAGDHAKAASDLGLDFTAVGLFLQEGYFAQRFTHDGWQLEDHPAMDPVDHPLEIVRDGHGDPLILTVQVGDVVLHLQAWRIQLGRNNIYLLDSDRPENPEELRGLAHRLYQGDRRTRLQQEIMLGIGGIRLLRALGVETDVYHMNEGHCAFLTLELLRERLKSGNVLEEAESWVRDHCVFTTHTPVLAGHDRFESRLLLEQLSTIQADLKFSDHDFLAYGRVHPQNPDESFTMTVLGLNLSRDANGVSKLNGEVAREQWHSLYPDRSLEEVPIDHITNGVHLSTWAVPLARAFLNEKLGNWKEHADDYSFWARIEEIPDEILWAYRNELRSLLVDFARRYARDQTLPIACELQPDALTIGFARRFATYKRAPLIFSDIERVAWLFGIPDRPVQI
ncbi:MAG: alpha-glucan family phosphorylase, partial [Rhodothermales bacterium]